MDDIDELLARAEAQQAQLYEFIGVNAQVLDNIQSELGRPLMTALQPRGTMNRALERDFAGEVARLDAELEAAREFIESAAAYRLSPVQIREALVSQGMPVPPELDAVLSGSRMSLSLDSNNLSQSRGLINDSDFLMPLEQAPPTLRIPSILQSQFRPEPMEPALIMSQLQPPVQQTKKNRPSGRYGLSPQRGQINSGMIGVEQNPSTREQTTRASKRFTRRTRLEPSAAPSAAPSNVSMVTPLSNATQQAALIAPTYAKKNSAYNLNPEQVFAARVITPKFVDLPYPSVDDAKRTSDTLPDMKDVTLSLLRDRPRMALRGVHVVVHDVYGSDTADGGFENAYGSFLPEGLYPSQWDGTTAYYGSSAKIGGTGWSQNDLASTATSRVSRWYAQSAYQMSANANTDQEFAKRCFTIDIDPASYDTTQQAFVGVARELKKVRSSSSLDQNFSKEARTIQSAIEQRAFNSFLQMLDSTFVMEDGRRLFDLIDESESKASWDYAERSTRRVSAFLNEWSTTSQILNQLVTLTSHYAFLNAVYWFLLNQWTDYDSLIGFMGKIRPTPESPRSEYKKQYFVEIIGFASAEDWQQSQHDFTLTESRRRAWDEWLTKVQSSANVQYNVAGFFALQQYPLAPYATTSPDQILSTWEHYDNKSRYKGFIGAILPVNFVSSVKPKVDNTVAFFSKTKLMSQLSEDGKFDKTTPALYLAFLEKTGLQVPKFLAENAINPFVSDMPFRRDEFGWANHVPVKSLGAGGFGNVLRVRFQESLSSSTPGNRMMRHHDMVLYTLIKQMVIFTTKMQVKQNAPESANSDFDVPKQLERIFLQTRDGKLEQMDFVRNESLELYNAAIQIVAHFAGANVDGDATQNQRQGFFGTIYSKARSTFSAITGFAAQQKPEAKNMARRNDFIAQMYQGYNADVRINVAVKYGEVSFLNRVESMVLQLCHLQRPITVYNAATEERGLVVSEFMWRPQEITGTVQRIENLVGGFKTATLSIPYNGSNVELRVTNVSAGLLNNKIPQETTFTATLNSENLVRSFGSGYDNQFTFMVIPLAAKGSLHSQVALSLPLSYAYLDTFVAVHGAPTTDDIINRKINVKANRKDLHNAARPLSIIELVKCLSDALSAIRFLNSKGISHSDIKPENILVDEVGRGILTDLSLSRPYGVPLGGLYGTPGYFPPIFQDKKFSRDPNFSLVDPLIDSYAFGKVLDHCVYGYYGVVNNDLKYTRVMGTSFNRAELDKLLTPYDSKFAVALASPCAHFRELDLSTPLSQRPVSLAMAKVAIDTLQAEANKLMDDAFTQTSITNYLQNPSILKRKRAEDATFNRLLGTQIVLDWLYEALIESVK